MEFVLIANGSIVPGPATDVAIQAAHADATVIAVDGGADNARRLAITPHLIIGDLDSIQAETLRRFRVAGVEVMEFSPYKDETDLELAILEAVERGAARIWILAAVGDRLDQTLANVYLLALPQIAKLDVKIVAGKQTMWLLDAGTHTLEGDPGDTISLIPFGGDADGISTTGLKYPLNDEALVKGPARGISNVMETEQATVTLKSGKLVIIHTIGRA